MASTRIAVRRAPFRPPAFPPLRPVPIRRVIYWPAVALAAAAGALFVGGVTTGIVLRPARAARTAGIALAAPPLSDPVPLLPEDRIAPTVDPAPTPDPVPPAPSPGADATRLAPPVADAAPPAPPPVADAAPPPVADATRLAPPPEPAATCQTFNTSVAFAVSPAAAEKQAAQDGKLVFLLHVSGDFADDAFT